MTTIAEFKYCAILSLALLFASCRAFEGLDKVESDIRVNLQIEAEGAVGSVSVMAPGVMPEMASREPGVNRFSFVRTAGNSKVPAWYCLVPARTDVSCDGRTSVLYAALPLVQYPEAGNPDKFSMLALTPAFGVYAEGDVIVQAPDSLLQLVTVRVSGLDAGCRVHSVCMASDSYHLSGDVICNLRKQPFEPQEEGDCFQSVSLLVPDGLTVPDDGIAELAAVIYRDALREPGASRIFVSSDNTLFSMAMETLQSDGRSIEINLASGAAKAAGKTLCFNDSNLYNTLLTSGVAKVVASDGSECNLEMSEAGCVSRNRNGRCCLSMNDGQYFKIPSFQGKEVTGVLLQLCGATSGNAVFDVYSGSDLVHTFSASTTGKNGGLTALSISDIAEEKDIFNLSGLKISSGGGKVDIAGLVLTVADYVDPHGWEDGHIDDSITDLFDIL